MTSCYDADTVTDESTSVTLSRKFMQWHEQVNVTKVNFLYSIMQHKRATFIETYEVSTRNCDSDRTLYVHIHLTSEHRTLYVPRGMMTMNPSSPVNTRLQRTLQHISVAWALKYKRFHQTLVGYKRSTVVEPTFYWLPGYHNFDLCTSIEASFFHSICWKTGYEPRASSPSKFN